MRQHDQLIREKSRASLKLEQGSMVQDAAWSVLEVLMTSFIACVTAQVNVSLPSVHHDISRYQRVDEPLPPSKCVCMCV